MVVEVGLVEAGEVFGVDGLRDVEAYYLGADRGIERAHFEVLRRGAYLAGRGGSHAGNVGGGVWIGNELFVASL
ncbi:hypothetical protein GmRootV15_53320 [Variovorax sp. V15]